MHPIVKFARDFCGVDLHPGQARVLSEYYESGLPYWLLLAGRRGGKSLLSDIIALYEAIVPDFTGMLRASEERFIIITSVRQANANQHIRNLSNMLHSTPRGAATIKAEQQDRIELTNGATILSLPASARAGRGYTASMVIFDELAHFLDSDGNSSADQVFDAFSPTIATFGDRGRLVITTTPASRTGIVYDLFDRSSQGGLTDYYVTKVDTRTLNPAVSEKHIDRARQRDPESAAVEYDAEFSDPISAYLSSEAIEKSIDYRLKEAERAEPGQSYVMAVDPATQRDRYAFLIAHRTGDGMLVVDLARILKPPVDLNAAEVMLFDLAERFGPTSIKCDTASTVLRLKDKLYGLEYTPFTRPMKLKIYGTLKEALNTGKLVLYPQQDLIDELKALQIRNGQDIAAPRSGRITHDDLTDCLALCADSAREDTWFWCGTDGEGNMIGDTKFMADQAAKKHERYPEQQWPDLTDVWIEKPLH